MGQNSKTDNKMENFHNSLKLYPGRIAVVALLVGIVGFLVVRNGVTKNNYNNLYVIQRDQIHHISAFSCLSAYKYNNALNAISNIQQQIYENWDVSNYPLFLSFVHIPHESWVLQKQKFIKLILGNERKKFVVAFSGSSVTAGHDNYLNQSYPTIFYNSLSPIMKALNIELIVRNVAIGNNPCFPYDACITTHAVSII